MNRQQCFLAAAFCLLSGVWLWGEELRWPLGIEISPSSSFMECRGLRFHGGIDLRTRRATGFPVYAIADGFVSRIKVQHRGFGYALYVDHPQLKIRSVFGHLEDFAEPMAGWTAKKLTKMGKRYGIDDQFGAETFPVKKGQVIAFTGETGLGPPHLHFELRNLQDEPLSPSVVGYQLPDRIMPEFTGLWLEPLKHGTSINGRFLPFQIPLKKKTASTWYWEDPIRVSGEAGLAVGVLDRGEGDNRMSVAEIRMILDDKEIFSREFKTYSYDENRQAPYVYDAARSSAPGLGYVAWLFKWPFESMMLSRAFSPWSGVLGPASQGTRLKIRIRDFGGLEALAEGPILLSDLSAMAQEASGSFIPRAIDFAFSGLVLSGEMKNPGREMDHLVLQTREGSNERVPARRVGNSLQIQIPYEAKWEPGVFLQGVQRAGPFLFFDKTPRELDLQAGMNLDIPAAAINFPVLAYATYSLNPPKSKRLVPLTGIWTFQPDWLITDKPMTLTIDVPAARACVEPYMRERLEKISVTSRQYGLYAVSGVGEPRHVGGDLQGEMMTFKTRSLGAFTICADLVPPTVSYSGRRTLKRFGPCFVFKVDDVGEGVDYEHLEATIDGKAVEVDSDPDHDEVYVVRPSRKGKGIVRLRVSDHAGNVSEGTQTR